MSSYIFSAPSIYLFGSAVLCAWLALHASAQRKTPFAVSYIVLMLCSVLYALGYGLEIATPDLAHMHAMLRVQYLGLPFVPLAWLAMAWSYMDPRGLPLRVFRPLLALSMLIFVAFQSNDLHHLYYADLAYSREGDLAIARITKGPLYWLYVVYLNLSVASGGVLLFRAWRQSVRLYHRQALSLLLGSLVPWLFHLIYLFGISPRHLDLSPFGLSASGLIVTYAVFRNRLFKVLPMAHDVVFEGISEGVIVLDGADRVVDFNRAARTFFPKLSHASIGLECTGIDEEGEFAEALGRRDRFELTQGQGTAQRHLEVHRYDLRDRQFREVGKAIAIQDVTEKKTLMNELVRRASYDELTGIYNRHHLIEQSAREVLLAHRYDRPLSLIVLDVDHFKEINDGQGHLAGDELLRGIARTMRLRLRSTDIFGRYGGDEFVITLPETRADDACEIAQQIRKSCAEEHGVGLSMGVAELSADVSADFDTLFRRADEALYQAKNFGRNRVERYRAESINA